MKQWFISFAILVVFFSACSDNESDPTGPNPITEAPQFTVPRVEVPDAMRQSSDVHAQTVVYYTGLANAFGAGLGGYLVPPTLNKTNASLEGPWEYTWKDGELQIKVTIRVEGDFYIWEVFYSGSDGDVTYNNARVYRAEQRKDDRSGKFFMFAPNTATVIGQYTWSLNDQNSILFEVIVSSDFTEGSRFVGTSNPDKSGVLEVFTNESGQYILLEKYVWNASGSGEWWMYDGGNEAGNGTWE